MKHPSISIVVCIHNALEYVKTCLRSVELCTPSYCNLILVNDGSDTVTTTWLKRYASIRPHVRLISNHPARGYTCAANCGLRESNDDYTILLNSDTIVSPGWVQGLVECGESDAMIGIVGPVSNAATYQSVPDYLDEKGGWKENVLPEGITVADYSAFVRWASLRLYPRVPVVNGFCFAVKRKVIDAIGYLDEESFPHGYGEENDYCARAVDAGFQLAVADDTYVYHAVSKSFGSARRDALVAQAHKKLRSKYPQERFDQIDYQLRHHQDLARVRQNIKESWPRWLQEHRSKPGKEKIKSNANQISILFLLPGCTAYAGGSQMVVELAVSLEKIGFPVKVAIERQFRGEYEIMFPGHEDLFYDFVVPEQLISEAGRHDVVVGTIFTSVAIVKKIIDRYNHILPAYFVQDYEPFFFKPNTSYFAEAEKSYTLIPGNLLFAISSWVVDQVRERHGVEVYKIPPSIQTEIYYPNFNRKARSAVRLTAMVRPSTPWRGAIRTMALFSRLHKKYGDRLEITVFGSDMEEVKSAGLPIDFPFTVSGQLDKQRLAELLRGQDIFIDLSDFQAFGRTALEAMACGCAVVAPKNGGVGDYGVDGENILMIDTLDTAACEQAVTALIEDEEMRRHMSRQAMLTASAFSSHQSAVSFGLLLSERLNRIQ